jgi:multidrug efflux pump subunit AcrA (membrane-fusion protein)
MKLTFCFAPLFAFAALCLCGCKRDDATDGLNAEPAQLQLFEKGKGLRLPDEMQRSLGVETVEVAEKLMTRQIEKPAQVYRAASDSQRAAALVWLNDAEATRLNTGQSVSLVTFAGEKLTGTLSRIEQHLTNLLGQSEAVIEFPDDNRRVPAGSLLTAVFGGANTNTVTAIPASAVVRGVENSFVYTASGAHHVRTPVKLGAESDGWVEIVDGLYSGDVVVARAVDALWTIELCALKGGTPCCPVGRKPGSRDDD